MRCAHCGLEMSLEDNFCRRCGAAVEIIEVPAIRGESRALTIWEGAKPAVVQGVMLVAAGAALRFLLGRTGRAMLTRAFTDADDGGLRRMLPLTGDRSSGRDDDEIEILWYRRVRR